MKNSLKILNVFLIIIAITIVSFCSAIVGIYIVFNNDNSKIPLLNKVDISKKIKNTSVVIEKKDEVHVDKDIQLQSSYKDTKSFLSYIAIKKASGEAYFDSDIIGFGVNATSDGYIITNENSIPLSKSNLNNNKYVVILNDSKVFDVTNIIYDDYGFVILKIDNQKINVPSFSYYDDVNIGGLVYSNNGPFGIEIDTVKNKENGLIELVNNDINKKYGIFDLSNKLTGFYGKDNKLYSANYLKNIIYSLSNNNGKILRPNLKIEYTDYTKIISLDENKISGFGITKVDALNSYGLLKNDIIKEIDGYAAQYSLDYMLQNYKVGDIINFKIIRDKKEIEIKIELK